MLHEDEIVETLIELYQSGEEKRKGAYKLDKEAFKSIAGRKHIRGDLLINLDIALWHEGYRLLNFMDSEGYVFLVKGSALGVIVKFCVWPVRRQSCLTDRSRVRRP